MLSEMAFYHAEQLKETEATKIKMGLYLFDLHFCQTNGEG